MFIEKLFSSPYASYIFTAVMTKEIDQFLEVAEAAHSWTKKSVAKKEYGDVLMLMDIWDELSNKTDRAVLDVSPFIIFKKLMRQVLMTQKKVCGSKRSGHCDVQEFHCLNHDRIHEVFYWRFQCKFFYP